MKKAIIAALAVIILCVGAACIDSCNRHNKSCFGATGTR